MRFWPGAPRPEKKIQKIQSDAPLRAVVFVPWRELSHAGGCSSSMKMASIANDPAHWRRRAQEARRIADQLDDPVAQKTMRDIALSYERLATLADAKLPKS